MQGKKIPITKEQVLSAIEAVAKELGRAPTREELEQLGGISPAVVRRHFMRHRSAVRAAGLEPAQTGPERQIQNEDLLGDWGELARRLKRAPTQSEYQSEGKYSYRCLVDRFQRWSLVAGAFQEAEGKGTLRGEWKDVVEILRSTPERGRARKDRWVRKFMAATRRARSIHGANRTDEINHGLPPVLAGKKCVTTTMLAVLVASIVLGGSFLRRVLPDRPLLGAPMHAAGLTHEPVNEMGVSMLFAMCARELGFIIESVQAAFPDCRAKMEVMPGRWQDVRIEFEYESRSFAEHGHDPNGCDVIVCWRHNWKGCPPRLMVVELSRLTAAIRS